MTGVCRYDVYSEPKDLQAIRYILLQMVKEVPGFTLPNGCGEVITEGDTDVAHFLVSFADEELETVLGTLFLSAEQQDIELMMTCDGEVQDGEEESACL